MLANKTPAFAHGGNYARVSVKEMSEFIRCPYIARNRHLGKLFAPSEDMVVGTVVHAARIFLNQFKRRFAQVGEKPKDMKNFALLSLKRARGEVPYLQRVDLDRVFDRALDILVLEWDWELGLLQRFPPKAMFPIKMEIPVKFPPGIYGRVDGILRNGGPIPVEYKTWDKGFEDIDRFQLLAYCAGVQFKYRHVPFGVLQYSSPPKRVKVEFGIREKELVLEIYREFTEFLSTGKTSRSPKTGACDCCGYLVCKHRGDSSWRA